MEKSGILVGLITQRSVVQIHLALLPLLQFNPRVSFDFFHDSITFYFRLEYKFTPQIIIIEAIQSL